MLVAALVIAVVATGAAIGASRGTVVIDGPSASGAEGEATSLIAVEIVGAVVRPGLLRVDADTRVGEAIAAAGGFGPRVDATAVAATLDLAAALKDGDRIVVPSRDDPPTASRTGDPPVDGLVDLNSATAPELEALPGIGEVTAAKIIAAREEARFASVDELRSRGIVGEKTFEKLRDLVTVR